MDYKDKIIKVDGDAFRDRSTADPLFYHLEGAIKQIYFYDDDDVMARTYYVIIDDHAYKVSINRDDGFLELLRNNYSTKFVKGEKQ